MKSNNKMKHLIKVLSLAVLAQGSFAAQVHAVTPASVQQAVHVKDAVLNEILKASLSVIKHNKQGAQQLSSALLDTFERTVSVTESSQQTIENNNGARIKRSITETISYTDVTDFPIHLIDETVINQLPRSTKETFIQSLPIDVKMYIFDEIGDRLINAPDRPFNTPCTNICQWDHFCLIIKTLLDNEPRFKALVSAIDTCVGIKDVWKIQVRLNKNEFYALIPQSFLEKFFTTNPVRMNQIKNRIKYLIER